MATEPREATALRVASLEILRVSLIELALPSHGGSSQWQCTIEVRGKCRLAERYSGHVATRELAVAQAVSGFCSKPIQVFYANCVRQKNGDFQTIVAVEDATNPERAGAGRVVAHDEATGLAAATLRAANNAGLLAADYRANNQLLLRDCASSLMTDLDAIPNAASSDRLQRLLVHSTVIEHLNKAASAAVLTAANHPKPETILSLFDTSVWLFDNQGRRRDSYTDTKLWLAWYPGIENDDLQVSQVIASMPAAPESKIPWIVRLFENPESWIRFRGAVDLADHDVMHALLGRGLQDQDEAFVLGFAMGTAKQVSWFQYWVFKFVLAWLYPEPYRIPNFLQPAFDLGVKCGQQTGVKDLYRLRLKDLHGITLGQARAKVGIDMGVIRRFYELEQQRIPFTIASLRLP